MKLSDLRKLGNEATAGPWHTRLIGARHEKLGVLAEGRSWSRGGVCLAFDKENQEYIAAARNHWEALLNIADALEAISCNLNEGEDLHYANDVLARLEAIK